MIRKTLVALIVGFALTGCEATSINVQSQQHSVEQADANTQMMTLAQTYFDESITHSPLSATFFGMSEYNDKFELPLGPDSLAQSRAFTARYLARLESLDRSELSGQAKLSYDILYYELVQNKAAEQFDDQFMPIDQMYGPHHVFAAMGSGESAQPFKTVDDYSNFLKRADGFVIWLQSVQAMMTQGIERKVVLPRAITAKVIPQFSTHVVDRAEDSVFWGPIQNLPDSFSDEEKRQITQSYKHYIERTLVPAYRDMVSFLETTYLPASRASVGYSALPNGQAWYQHYIKENTTLDMTATEIHQLGLSEVKRIRDEMSSVKEQVGFEGDLQAFFEHLRNSDEFYFQSEAELIKAYEDVKKKIDARVPLLFDIKPKADYVVKPVEAFRAASAPGASYESPAPDGSRPGVFYINSHNLKAQPKFIVETLSIHEAAPGHHFQLALQQEIDDLPEFRKFGGSTVFVEGWALYAESLGKELGLFTDPYQWYGRLSDEQLRAMRLVVDTGLHAKGWTRAQAIDFMLDNSSMAKSDVEAEVERYIAWPGQAVSYKVGQFKIRQLREYAEQELGERFDIRAFHNQVLIDGAVPMPVLEVKIQRWVESQK
ncbi:DUF885 domain-containing protein [Pseudoalteromonas ardens]|uniref:DUF885 domain-containing protein n=1 Tax=Pseudoalteromonas rubra TaxID=43658 RepID=A0A0L0ERY7_9GAMM|nr:DUF885 domain-containing protein [Pseudoalteromonas sp. R96]KNC67179.1 hypothetical protein AC626_12435 [Pseudoalteromonas rubra]MDK1310023.1 DUF885 domain-containing protein [Pseudoalteromonas sp. R96]